MQQDCLASLALVHVNYGMNVEHDKVIALFK